jgi:hypothetical protein
VVTGVLAGRLALEVPGGAGEERGVVDGARHVELAGQLEGLPALQGLGLGELLGTLGEHGGEAVQRVGAFPVGGARPAGEGRAGGGHGRVHVGGARQLVGVHLFAGGGVDDRVGAAGRALGQTARDVLRSAGEAVLRLEAMARIVHVALLRRPPRRNGGRRSSSSI